MFFRPQRTRLVASLVLSAFFCFESAAQAQSVVIASDPWCPFVCDSDGPQQGIMVDIAIEALAISGYDVTYRNINWARAKRMVRDGDADGIVGTAKGTPESTPYHFPKTALGVAETCFFRRTSDDWSFTSPQSIDAKSMGWINDYMYGDDNEWLNDWVRDHKGTSQVLTVSGDDTHSRLFKLLLRERIDTFAEDRFVTSYALKQQGLLDKITVAGCMVPPEKVYVAFSRETENGEILAKALDKGVEELRQNGRLAVILAAYGLTVDALVAP